LAPAASAWNGGWRSPHLPQCPGSMPSATTFRRPATKSHLEIGGDLEANLGKAAFLVPERAADAEDVGRPCGIFRCCCRRWRSVAKVAASIAKECPVPAPATAEESYASLDAPRADASEQSLSATAAPACVSDLQEEDDFYDAHSDFEDEPCDEQRPSPSRMPHAAVVKRAAEVHRRLQRLLAIERKCRGQGAESGACADPDGLGSVEELKVESVLAKEATQMWFCHSSACPFVIGCLRCVLSGVVVEDAVEAIQSPEQRLGWDGESFRSFELLRPHEPSDPTREDVVFTVMPAPRPARDREILQRRWQVPVGDSGGQALLMQSLEDDALCPTDPARVRAFTHLSGYILRPVPGSRAAPAGLEVVVISQCDLGGQLPGWLQNMARRLAKHRCMAWGRQLQAHCQARAQSGSDQADATGITNAMQPSAKEQVSVVP